MTQAGSCNAKEVRFPAEKRLVKTLRKIPGLKAQ